MRQERTVQASVFDLFATHEIGHELKAMSRWLDEHRDLLGLVVRDLGRRGVKATGLPAEAVLRCALLKQYRQLSYQELAFHLEDSASFRAFARLPWSWSPQKSVLQKTISAIRPATWEQINRALLSSAQQTQLVAASDKLVGHSGRSSRLAPGVFVLRPDITRCTLSGIAEQRREAIPWCGTGSSGSGYPSRRPVCCSARCSSRPR
jgi:IS5 family transposase